MARQARTQEMALHIMFSEVLRCLRIVHAAGIVHSDVKPDNCLTDGTRWFLIDFGLAGRAGALGLVCFVSTVLRLVSGSICVVCMFPCLSAFPFCRGAFGSDMWCLPSQLGASVRAVAVRFAAQPPA